MDSHPLKAFKRISAMLTPVKKVESAEQTEQVENEEINRTQPQLQEDVAVSDGETFKPIPAEEEQRIRDRISALLGGVEEDPIETEPFEPVKAEVSEEEKYFLSNDDENPLTFAMPFNVPSVQIAEDINEVIEHHELPTAEEESFVIDDEIDEGFIVDEVEDELLFTIPVPKQEDDELEEDDLSDEEDELLKRIEAEEEELSKQERIIITPMEVQSDEATNK